MSKRKEVVGDDGSRTKKGLFYLPDLEEENRKKLEKNENMKVALSMRKNIYHLPIAEEL